MSQGHWRPIAAIGGVVLLLLAAGAVWAFLTQPTLEAPLARPAINLAECGYEEARQSTRDARQRRDSASPRRSERARRRDDHRVEAAEQEQANARECEERLHERADLEAQWAAATAAKNAANVAVSQWRWAYIEFAALLFTLGAAAWAAWETRRAADVARQAFEESERPLFFVTVSASPNAPGLPVRLDPDADDEDSYADTLDPRASTDSIRYVHLHNVGTRPAFGVSFKTVFGFGAGDERVRDESSGLAHFAPGERKREFTSYRSKTPILPRIESGERLLLTGFFVYDDALGIRRERGFQFEGKALAGIIAIFERDGIQWEQTTDPAANYDRRVEKD